ncbi:hypothetical protein [Saliphagus sp. LR7]|uniref:hypothetical protein n=1 Tax=Saliphagus sp. LR7 TaxID=2282654 RepID=UPI0013004C6B|nr:hypothetical protein [Saliphagus sp. LR7]
MDRFDLTMTNHGVIARDPEVSSSPGCPKPRVHLVDAFGEVQQCSRSEFGVQDRVDRLLSRRISTDVSCDDNPIEEFGVR